MRNLRKTCNDNGENLLFQTIADPLENVNEVNPESWTQLKGSNET